MEKVVIGNAELYLGDCMDGMQKMCDKTFQLAIVDPEYGMDAKGPCGRFERYGTLQSVNGRPPDQAYFEQLFRVAEKSIIWGGNYFNLPPCQAFIIWDKQQPEGLTFADSEFAWTNFTGVARTFRCRPQNADDDGRIHPTQKPIKLYRWLLSKYGQPGQTVIDTHMGSGSSVIACLDLGHKVTAFETNPEYFERACIRIEKSQRQLKLAI